MDRYSPKAALLALSLVLAACGGHEPSADTRGGVSVRGESDRPAAVASGGDTAASTHTARTAAPTTAPASTPASTATAPAASSSPAGPNAASAPAPGTAAAPTPSNAKVDANELLARVERTAAGIRTLQADFVQNLRVPLLGTDKVSRGKLYQRKPDRFLMKFSDPAGDVMVADGRHFWLYYPSNDKTQVIRTSIAQGGEQADFQKQFLSNATARFNATLAGEEVVDGRPAWALTLVPKGSSPYKSVRIWVDKADGMVRRFEITEENDSVRRVELRNLVVNQPVSDALFTFSPSPGTHVFDQ